jgi:hypothetical protein
MEKHCDRNLVSRQASKEWFIQGTGAENDIENPPVDTGYVETPVANERWFGATDQHARSGAAPALGKARFAVRLAGAAIFDAADRWSPAQTASRVFPPPP